MRASPNTEPLHEHQAGPKIDWLPPHLTPCLLFYPWVLRGDYFYGLWPQTYLSWHLTHKRETLETILAE